ncbi:MAG: flagellar hook-length control protein FliK, partial [Treponema sp.]|nr:flagellar hook-length control protein FliK [Treponema sp.]
SKEVKPLAEAKASNSVFTIVDERTAVQNTKDEPIELKEDSVQALSAKSDDVQLLNADAARVQSQQNILASNNQSAGATGSTFQAMLSQQIQENAPEFVKAGSIILRDNNSGTINMTMKPESLGNVKISLEVSDKVIAGQITVHSQEAYDAFKQNLDVLKQAFQQNGFDSAGFTLNLAQSGNSGSFGQEQHQMAQEFMSNRTYGELASTGESSVQETESSAAYSKSSGYQIDVVA